MRAISITDHTTVVYTISDLLNTANSRILNTDSKVGEIRELAGHSDPESFDRLYYAHLGIHTGSSVIEISPSFLARLENVTVVPNFLHIVTSSSETIYERFGSKRTFPYAMYSYGSYFGYCKHTNSFEGPYHPELALALKGRSKPIRADAPIFLLSNDLNDRAHGHWLLQQMALIFHNMHFLKTVRPIILFTYPPTSSQIDVMLTIYPWLNDFQFTINTELTTYESLFIPFGVDETSLDTEYLMFLKTLPLLSHQIAARRLYVSREDAPSRRMLNEQALVQQLESYGFEKYVVSGKSFSREVCDFHESSRLIYINGAHVANTVFCQSSAMVCAITTSRTVLRTAISLNNFGLRNIEFNNLDPKSASSNLNADFNLKIDEFLQCLQNNEFF